MLEILTNTPARVLRVNPGTESIGGEDVPSVDLRLEVIQPNNILHQFDSRLLGALYYVGGESADGRQINLAGVEAISEYPHLKFPNLKPLTLLDEYSGYTLEIAKDSEPHPISLDRCKLWNFLINCKEGGYCVLRFNIARSMIDEVTLGRLGVLTLCDVSFRLLPPSTAEGTQQQEE
jgi:hypothetical protein